MQAKKQEKMTRHHFQQFFENFIKIVQSFVPESSTEKAGVQQP